MTEAQWQRTVTEAATVLGWKVYHTHDSRRSAPGFPDLVLGHPEQHALIFAELKTDTGRVRPEQREWLDLLRRCGQRAYVWRPREWTDVQTILRGGLVPAPRCRS